MSLHLPSRRVLGTAPTILKSLRPSVTLLTLSPPIAQQTSYSLQQLRTIRVTATKWKDLNSSKENGPKDPDTRKLGGRGNPDDTPPSNKRKMEEREDVQDQLRRRLQKRSLEGESIFGEALRTAADVSETTSMTLRGASLAKEHMQRAIDPDPRSRVRWERKMVIHHIRRKLDAAGRETKEERIRRTERVYTSNSLSLPTSTKKLMYLAQQIAGKTVDDALMQMKFSRKMKNAAAVTKTLERTRARAIVARGMGLGRAKGEAPLPKGKEIKIRTKDGRPLIIDDPTRMYIAEAWVTRNPLRGISVEHRARGRKNILKHRSSKLFVRLKEEKTRIREYEERKAKEYRRGPWIHLPDRPVTAQRPFYCW